ncbi:tripartite tricarboxylate transporter substrate binding protein [Microvirga massiliensis]|uniref:tripartite tricarboxylate transporter substrate binding protein n=1 Tax=Microvirga massiliensis TaxID=1033741 RepID=UPI00062B950C|nr:tripartite tricarboxylate transporter substrate binding protein [Microvirga massiliensis]
MLKKTSWLVTAAFAVAVGGAAQAAWQPTKPVEFVVTSSPGGGTDNFARMVQSIIAKHKLMDQSVIVTNKGGGSGAEGFVYTKVAAGDPHKLTFGTNNAYLLPYVAKLAYKSDELTPVAAMALDEFLLWVKADAPYTDAKSYIEAAKAKPEALKMGGSQSKDTDQTLTSLIEEATGAKFIYIPFQGGGTVAVQLAGGHIDSNTNNPNENVGQWKAGAVKPLCVFSPTRLQSSTKVTATMGWSDIPTCKEAGIPIDQFQMPRTVWLPSGVPSEAVAFYADVLKKVSETPEWKEYIERTSQTNKFLSGDEFKGFIADDQAKNRKVFEREGWIVQ